jgi:hypothetical protein
MDLRSGTSFQANDCDCRRQNRQVFRSRDGYLVAIQMHLDREHRHGAV